jgi:hypothetical protein
MQFRSLHKRRRGSYQSLIENVCCMIKVVVAACFFLISNVLSGSTGDRIEFELPIRCKIGIDCFVQNLVDLDASPGILDPWCGSATYDGHKGTDIRPLSLMDIEKNIAVVAAATGRVRGIRDGEPDILIKDKADHARVAKIECGNGLVIAHEGGFETQYCHMKSGSIAVKLGETVKTGDLLGYVGASGLAQFPHLHLTVRQNGKWVDPLSGSHSGEPCIASGKPPNSYWSKSALAAFDVESAAILAIGIAGNVLIHDRLVVDGPPPRATTKTR